MILEISSALISISIQFLSRRSIAALPLGKPTSHLRQLRGDTAVIHRAAISGSHAADDRGVHFGRHRHASTRGTGETLLKLRDALLGQRHGSGHLRADDALM